MAQEEKSVTPTPEAQPQRQTGPEATATTQESPPKETRAAGKDERVTDKALGDSVAPEKSLDIDFLLDIPLQVKVEIGRTRVLINDLLRLSQGSVIELQKLVGEPFEVLVNEKLIARGEVVVVNERFGVRLTDIISPMERIQQLG